MLLTLRIAPLIQGNTQQQRLKISIFNMVSGIQNR